MKALKIAGIVLAVVVGLAVIGYAAAMLVLWWCVLYFFHPREALWIAGAFIVIFGVFLWLTRTKH